MHFQGPEKDKSSRKKSQAKRDIGFNLDEMTAEDFTRGHSLFDYSAQGSANPAVHQRQEQAQATMQKKGIGVNDDPELEKEEDEIGKAAAEGKEAETPVSASTGRVDAIQRKISEENSILDDLETTGAGDATKNQDKLTDLNGAEASKKMAETDLVRIKNYIAIFKEAGTNHGLPPALLAAISSRESRGGKLLKEDGYGADDSGFGIMQVDEGSHTLEGTYDSKEHVMQAASILADYHKQVKKKHPDWTKAEQLRGAVAAYNFGVSNVDTLAGIDKGSTGNDYSSDIWARAKYYASLPEFGASDDAAVVSEASKESTVTKEFPIEEISAEEVNSDTPATTTTTTSEETSDKVPTAESAATTRDPGQFYTVQKGDNPKMLAIIFKTTVEKLKADNEDKWKVWGEKSEGFNAGEKIYISDVAPATIAAIEAERKKAVLDKEEAERLARLKKEQEAKAKKEATENPKKAVEEKKANPAEVIDKIWNEYKSGKLGFIEMGKALIPYGIGNGDKVIEIIDKLGDYSKDDLSYVITSNSSPAILSSLDKSLLSRMSAELGNIWITKSWFMHSEQKERIDRVLNQFPGAKGDQVKKGLTASSDSQKEPTPAKQSTVNAEKSQKDLNSYFVAFNQKDKPYSSGLKSIYGSRHKVSPYAISKQLNGHVGADPNETVKAENKAEDLKLVVSALKQKGFEKASEEIPTLIEIIIAYQKTIGVKIPDGNISPNGVTAKKLGLNSAYTIGRVGRSKTKDGKYIYAEGTNEEEYFKKIDLIEKNIGVKKGSKEEMVLEAAREASQDQKFFDIFTKNVKAKLDWETRKPVKSEEGRSLSSVLENRMVKFHKFCVAVGLYSGNMLVMDAVRGPKTAHKWSVEHFVGYNDKYDAEVKKNLIEMYNSPKFIDGNEVKDLDKTPWAEKQHFIFDPKNPKKATGVKINEVKSYIKERKFRMNPSSIAAEGYISGEERKPLPITGSPGQSLHISGNAIDINSMPFLNRNDAVIDLVALNFGLVRSAGGEQWHFEARI